MSDPTHSRIEWVWLHWSEYLKASEEFEIWLTRQQCNLDVRVELQLGVKEKLWQVDQQSVVVSDIQSQTTLLERLLDEAAALYNRTQDPSVEAQAQERLQEAYNNIRDRAKVSFGQTTSALFYNSLLHTYTHCMECSGPEILPNHKGLQDPEGFVCPSIHSPIQIIKIMCSNHLHGYRCIQPSD